MRAAQRPSQSRVQTLPRAALRPSRPSLAAQIPRVDAPTRGDRHGALAEQVPGRAPRLLVARVREATGEDRPQRGGDSAGRPRRSRRGGWREGDRCRLVPSNTGEPREGESADGAERVAAYARRPRPPFPAKAATWLRFGGPPRRRGRHARELGDPAAPRRRGARRSVRERWAAPFWCTPQREARDPPKAPDGAGGAFGSSRELDPAACPVPPQRQYLAPRHPCLAREPLPSFALVRSRVVAGERDRA